MNIQNELEELVLNDKPVHCTQCGGKMVYKSNGVYYCEDCGAQELDNYGKIHRYIEENGTSNGMEIADGTGVPIDYVIRYLRKGRIQITENSERFIPCERCGCDIKFGRFCPDCIKELCDGIQVAFHEDMGEKPRSHMEGKMHFLNRNI
jgi:hypothetical protein